MIKAQEVRTFRVICTECGERSSFFPTIWWQSRGGITSLKKEGLPWGWSYDEGSPPFIVGHLTLFERNPDYREPRTLCKLCTIKDKDARSEEDRKANIEGQGLPEADTNESA